MTISLQTMPAIRLAGVEWEGTYAEAATGVIGKQMEALRNRLGLGADAHMFGVSRPWWRPDGFRHFIGILQETPDTASAELQILELPSLTCLTCAHSGGDATHAYARLMTERDQRGLSKFDAVSMIDEHLPDNSMRLWLPTSGN